MQKFLDDIRRWWYGRDYRRRQREFKHTGTRYYGDGGTIHGSTVLDVETDVDGAVVAVWFRCQMLPFKQARIHGSRANEMRLMYARLHHEIHGVEIRDEPVREA